jgi:hypothetical protein
MSRSSRSGRTRRRFGAAIRPTRSAAATVILSVSCAVTGLAAPVAHADVVNVASSTGYPSDDCFGGALFNGYVRTTYVQVEQRLVSPNEEWVCVRVDGDTLNAGGKFVVTAPVAGAGIPVVDDNSDACSASSSGNSVPGPHPTVGGALGDPADPSTYLPFLLDTYASNAGAWVCLQVGAIRERVVVPVGVGLVPPTVTFFADAPGRHVAEWIPFASAPPAAPSGTCQANGGTQYVDLGLFGFWTDRVYVYTWQPSATVLDICVGYRNDYQRTVAAGGMLTVDTTNTGSIANVTTGPDLGSCLNVVGISSPTTLAVGRSPGTSLPASVCVTVGTTTFRITASGGAGLQPANVQWTPDPGTP